MIMRFLTRTVCIAATTLFFGGLNLVNAAPVTLEWVTTSSTTGVVTYGCESCLNRGQPFAQTRTGTSAGVTASFVLADASLLTQQTLTFSNSGFQNLNNSLIGARVSAIEPFVSGSLIEDGTFGGANSCLMGVRDQLANPGRCSVSVALARDTANQNRYLGFMSFDGVASGITVGADRLIWFGTSSTARAVNSLAMGGYWQVAGANNVPLPSGLVLFASGLGLLFAARRR
jgi:hypothetical protein